MQQLCNKHQQRPLARVLTANWAVGLTSHFCSPQPDASLSCELPGSGLVRRGNVPFFAEVQRTWSKLCVNSPLTRITQRLWCLLWDSNLGPSNYESSSAPSVGHHAARIQVKHKHNRMGDFIFPLILKRQN